MKRGVKVAATVLLALCAGCRSVDDERIPSMRVNINVSPTSVWERYGVSSYGSSRNFVIQLRQPEGFSYFADSATGFGGVLLVCGLNPFTAEAAVPLAYDLACPVERKSGVRVRMEPGDPLPVARCPECGSTYNVVEGGGAPTGGPALSDHYGLRRYECVAARGGGYLIYNPSY